MGFPEPPHPSPEHSATQPEHSLLPISVRVGCLLAWFGLCLCFLLLQRETSLHALVCPVRGSCETVLNSPYAQLRGIPLPWFGAAFYLVVFGLWLAVGAVSSLPLRLWLLDGMLWALLAGLTFSLGLMYVQFGVLHAFCPLCTASALTVVASVVTAFRARRVVSAGPVGASPAGALTLAVFATFPILIFVAGIFAQKPSAGGLLMMDLSTAHRLGPANAPVQMVVYSDFQCGFCKQLAPVLRQVSGEFPKEVAVVFRYYPLPGHPRAIPSAVAAECAAEQGLFWEYHDKLFAEGGDLDDARLLALAGTLGLDQQRFETCLRSDKPRRAVEANLREATMLDLPGTPFVFLNGRPLEGPPTIENLRQRIQKILSSGQDITAAKSR